MGTGVAPPNPEFVFGEKIVSKWGEGDRKNLLTNQIHKVVFLGSLTFNQSSKIYRAGQRRSIQKNQISSNHIRFQYLQAGQKWSELDQMTRAELEQDCDFLGLIIMQVINFRQALEFLTRQFFYHACTQSFQFILTHVLRLGKGANNQNGNLRCLF